jgi:threonine/homoserine/homoserine lactone efflux protein
VITDFIIPGISIGLSAVSIPGPSIAYLINVTLRYGWRRGLLVILAPLITDPPVVLVILLMLETLQNILPGIVRVIQIAGGLLLLWIAWNGWKGFRAGATFGQSTMVGERDKDGTTRQILMTAVLMNLLSPGLYIFWSTVNGPILLRGMQTSVWHGIAFLLAFYGTFLGGMAVISFVFAKVGQINPTVTRVLTLITIGLLVFFGIRLIAEAVFL